MALWCFIYTGCNLSTNFLVDILKYFDLLSLIYFLYKMSSYRVRKSATLIMHGSSTDDSKKSLSPVRNKSTFEESVKKKFNERTADERKQIIKKIQPYVSHGTMSRKSTN